MTNSTFFLSANSLSKYFSYGKYIFSGVNVSVSNNTALAITGENGSGKSTLLKILSLIIQPTKGDISFKINEQEVKKDLFFTHIGFVSPYLILYEEFSPMEHFKITADLSGGHFNKEFAEEYLSKFKLYHKRNDHIKTFSSGMKQRVKFIQALQNNPNILFLDEPFSNLDHDGIDIILEIMKNHLDKNCALVIASNDERETSLCKEYIDLTNFK